MSSEHIKVLYDIMFEAAQQGRVEVVQALTSLGADKDKAPGECHTLVYSRFAGSYGGN